MAAAAVLLTASGVGLSQSLERTFSRAVSRTNQPIVVTASFASDTALRGFCLMEEVPVGLTFQALGVRLNGTAITNFTIEAGQAADTYPGSIPVRFVLETPPAFSEAHPLSPGDTVQITYSLSSSNSAAFYLRPAVWTALNSDTAVADFGFGSGPNRLAFVGGTSALPEGAFWSLTWQHTSGMLSRWTMVGTTRTGNGPLDPQNPGSGWRVRCTPDATDDGQADLVLQHSDGRLAAWMMDNLHRTSFLAFNPSRVQPGWNLITAADLNGNSQQDWLFQHTNGSLAVWFMAGTNSQSSFLNPPLVPTSWRLVAAGKFANNSPVQLLWQHQDGWLSLWSMAGTNRITGGPLNPSKVDPKWKIVGAVDIDGDGLSEILLRHDNGSLRYWSMQGTNRIGGGPLTPGLVDPSWKVVGANSH